MGIFNSLFKKNNILEDASNIICEEEDEEKKLLFNRNFQIVNKVSDLHINRKGVLSFATACLCFTMDTDKKAKGVKFKKDYLEFVENIKKRDDFQLIYKFLMDYYNGLPTFDKALKNLTYAYIAVVWGISKEIHDPIFHVGFAMYIAKERALLNKYFSNLTSEFVESK